MAALIHATRDGRIPGEVALVLGENPDAPALSLSRELGVPTTAAPLREWGSLLQSHDVEWLCLAGFLKLLPADILFMFGPNILNIHPALLPKFGGKGMYGHHVHEAVLAAGEKVSGCTVHRVTERYDEGPILLQLRCAVEPTDTPETLAKRVNELEHQAYPLALGMAIAAWQP